MPIECVENKWGFNEIEGKDFGSNNCEVIVRVAEDSLKLEV